MFPRIKGYLDTWRHSLGDLHNLHSQQKTPHSKRGVIQFSILSRKFWFRPIETEPSTDAFPDQQKHQRPSLR